MIITDPETISSIVKVFILGGVSFIFAFFFTPALTGFLYKNKLWKKEVKEKAIDGSELTFFKKFHSTGETKVPRMGGLLIWGTVVLLAFLFLIASNIFDTPFLNRLNFLSREQTWLPLFTLVAASIVGLIDDVLQTVRPKKKLLSKIWLRMERYVGGGLSLKFRIILVTIIGSIGAWWFYFKLGQDMIHIPGIGEVFIGLFYVPLFIIFMLAIYSGGVIDGLDGLSGGVFASIFGSYAVIALYQGQINIAAFCFVILGSLLAFLWFNIPPARFYMGETGILGLTTTVTVIAFLTNAVIVLPIIAILLVIETASVILQLLSKKFRGKKLFLAAPIHHHFEALGWPHYKITMRFWVIGIVSGIIGVIIHLLS